MTASCNIDHKLWVPKSSPTSLFLAVYSCFCLNVFIARCIPFPIDSCLITISTTDPAPACRWLSGTMFGLLSRMTPGWLHLFFGCTFTIVLLMCVLFLKPSPHICFLCIEISNFQNYIRTNSEHLDCWLVDFFTLLYTVLSGCRRKPGKTDILGSHISALHCLE